MFCCDVFSGTGLPGCPEQRPLNDDDDDDDDDDVFYLDLSTRSLRFYYVIHICKVLADPPQCNGLRCPSVHLSVCRMRISPKLSKIDIWLGGSRLSLYPFRQKCSGWDSECSE